MKHLHRSYNQWTQPYRKPEHSRQPGGHSPFCQPGAGKAGDLESQPPPFGGMILDMLPWNADLAGRMNEHVISSELLRGNPLGDPCDRPILVYTPPGYGDEPDRAYPVVYVGSRSA